MYHDISFRVISFSAFTIFIKSREIPASAESISNSWNPLVLSFVVSINFRLSAPHQHRGVETFIVYILNGRTCETFDQMKWYIVGVFFLFAAYPLAFIYRAFFYKANSTLQVNSFLYIVLTPGNAKIDKFIIKV